MKFQDDLITTLKTIMDLMAMTPIRIIMTIKTRTKTFKSLTKDTDPTTGQITIAGYDVQKDF